jgi:DNA-3-methyladenine glycosylase
MRLVQLPRRFYLRPTLQVARDLLGCFLVRRSGGRRLIGRIVEVEAYMGKRDPASHAWRGKTRRNAVMFRRGGHLYVYFTYGMHYCANVVTEPEGKGRAVLLRALEPVEGVDVMKRKRRRAGMPAAARNLTNGPARLAQAMGIDGRWNGADLCGAEVFVARDLHAARREPVARTGRVGIRRARLRPWRFLLRGNSWVSRPRP